MAKILNIITHPNDKLRQISVKIESEQILTPEFQETVKDMFLTMKKKDGIGLAAPQVGMNIRLVVISTEKGPVCMVNPVLTKKSFAKELGEEGCLSIPDVFGNVRRHKKVTCKFFNEKNQQVRIDATGLIARAIQHELDHLDGILFIDKEEKADK